jgi:ketosteroid isomerase-like protein
MTGEEFIRGAYEIAEEKDIQGWIDCFTPDGVFVDHSVEATYVGPTEVAKPVGMLPPTGKDMDAPCCDVFKLEGGKIKRFHCYPEASVILTQLGVIENFGAVLEPLPA